MTSVLKKITSKIADIFNIFDFSFIISAKMISCHSYYIHLKRDTTSLKVLQFET